MEYSPHEIIMIFSFIKDCEKRLMAAHPEPLDEITKTIFSYLKDRARLEMNKADAKFSKAKGGEK